MFTMALLTAGWNFFRAHWRPFALAAALLACFVAGRCTSHRSPAPACPAAVTQKTDAQEHKATQVDEHKTEQKAEHRTVVTHRTTFTPTDAGVVLQTHEDVTETDDDGDATATDTHEHVDDTQKVATQTTTKPAPSDAPRWNAGLSVGLPLNLRRPLELHPDGMVDLSVRVWGPFWLEGWASSPLQRWAPEGGLRARWDVSW